MLENFKSNPYMRQVAEDLKKGHGAVMVGAGFSKNAVGITSTVKPPLDWYGLADVFYGKLHGLEPEQISRADTAYLNPLDLAEEVEAAFGRPVLDQIICNAIPDMDYKPSALHTKLLKLSWKEVFTTNYDTLLERASDDITETRFNPIYEKEDLVNSGDATRIVKLHGSFPSHRPFIITREDYRRYPHDFAPFVNTVQQALLENTLCLIGFSGNDPNFNNWIGWIHDNLGKENSSQIYLVVHGKSENGRKKLLQSKKIIEVDIR